jgi:hypothetical protein
MEEVLSSRNYPIQLPVPDLLEKPVVAHLVGVVDYCWSSPAQLFVVLGPALLKTIFFCLTTLGVVSCHLAVMR